MFSKMTIGRVMLSVALLLAQPVSGRRSWLRLREAEIPLGEGTQGTTEDTVRPVALEDRGNSGTAGEEPTLTSDTCDATLKVLADDGEDGDRFGQSTDIDGDYLIVGAPFDDIDGNYHAGSAYVLHRDDDGGWSRQTKLVAKQPTEDDYFGSSVAISNDTALVGKNGKVEVFVLQDGPMNDWSWEATLEGSGDYSFGNYGLDIDGNTAIVGEPVANNFKGKAYIYVRDDETREWSEPQVLQANDGGEGDWFGYSVAVRFGDTAIVGAPDVYGQDHYAPGSAYMFVRDEADITWKEQAKLTASDRTNGDAFGRSVAVMFKNYVFVGAIDTNTQSGGTVYGFVLGQDGWEERSSVTGQEFGAASGFGDSLAADLDRVVIGATVQSYPAGNGKAYLFDVDVEGKLTMDRELVAQGLVSPEGGFGYSVGISGGTIVVGEPGDTDDNNVTVGSTYIFDVCASAGEGDEGGDGGDMGVDGRYVRRG